jgi:hypothetical protein
VQPVAKALGGTSFAKVATIVRAHGINTNRGKALDASHVVALYQLHGSLRRVATELNTSPTSAQNPHSRWRRPASAPFSNHPTTNRTLYAEGKSLAEVGAIFGRSVSWTARNLERSGIERRQYPGRDHDQNIVKLYVHEQLSTTAIAHSLGLTTSSVGRVLQRNEVQLGPAKKSFMRRQR